MVDNKGLLDTLFKSLKIISKVTYGYVTITDRQGKRLVTVNYKGEELPALKGLKYELAEKAALENCPQYGMSQLQEGAEAWCIPLGDYILCASNYERKKFTKNLYTSLSDALPLIAKVVGGEAVMFDKYGRRIVSVQSDGTLNENYIEKISEDAKRAMTIKRPVIGNSNYLFGASAVRIPITEEFGIGFNNEDSVAKSQKLINEIKKIRTAKYDFNDIIGQAPPVLQCKELAKQAAQSSSSVLIIGESGTGKELYAQAIHNNSERKRMPFVAVNCASIPTNLLESSFFGYEKGAFTDAAREGKSGFFEQANGGTLFLDEISEMMYDLQSKLLRVIQEREVKRIGSNKPIALDIRIISATNKKLEEMVKKNQFRLDLYYRLNVLDIDLPPLREIKEDIPLICNYYIKKMSSDFGKFIEGFSDEAMLNLISYDWPGNVRELVNVIEKAFNIITDTNYIELKHLPLSIREIIHCEDYGDQTLSAIVKNYEKKVIREVLSLCGHSKVEAAKKLGISTTTLWRKLGEKDD